VHLAAQAVEREPSVLLRLEAPVEVELGFGAGGEERDEGRHDREEDRQHGDELGQRVSPLPPGRPGEAANHFSRCST
jgi:hypothetical protein